GDYDVKLTGNLLLTLANLCNDVYSDSPSGYSPEGFTALGSFDLDPNNSGYAAGAYIDSGGSQVVIAFRGTVPSLGAETFKDLAADTSFGSSIASPNLRSQVSDAAEFVKDVYDLVQETDPSATIILTGHSLGAAIAQLVGKASGLNTEVFNAPGAAQLYQNLQ